MGTEANNQNQDQINANGQPVTPAKPEAKAEGGNLANAQDAAKKGDAAQQAQTQAKPAGEAKQAVVEQKKHSVKGDEDIPEDADLIELSSLALKRRLDRHTKKELRDRFGTDDFDAIKKKMDKLAELEKGEDDRRKAALSKEERLQEERDEALRRAEAAEERSRTIHEDRVVDQEDGRLKDLASKHIKVKFWKHVARDLAEHLREEYTDEQLADLKDKDIEKWLTGTYLKENPEYARGASDVKKEPLTNTSGDEERPQPAKDQSARNFSPKGPNAMTRQEAYAAARAQGINWRG